MNTIEEYKRTRQLLFDREGIRPKSKMVATDGPVKNVHYLELGTGKPLILIHGGGSHASEWINIMKPLAKHFHLYIVDRPGHGLTDPFNYQGVDIREHVVSFIGSFMDAVGLEKAIFMGNSMGGYFSLCFSLQCPERVDKLILIGAPASVNRWIPPMLRLLGIGGVNLILTRTLAKPSPSNIKTIYKMLLVSHPEKLSDDYYLHCYYGERLEGHVKSFTSLLQNVLSLNGWKRNLYLGDQLHLLKIPVRFIWGEKDAFEKPKTGLSKARNIKDYKFEVIKNAGHCPWLDQTEKCASLIISMLNGQAIATNHSPVLLAEKQSVRQ
ncbi:MAG TPA: alpha/beta hydrolase [Sunxiuqinia sp.]|nr:alpha/beta hydrolase [Sunxiuqinia sp.]